VRVAAPSTQLAASAAFAIGTIEFDRKRDYAAAARSFALALEEQESGPLAREALGRQVEALARANDRIQAALRAKRYLALYPDGPHAQLARTLVH
jgi:outer membrane protein assembly factor BamD (BamD/ComL family)